MSSPYLYIEIYRKQVAMSNADILGRQVIYDRAKCCTSFLKTEQTGRQQEGDLRHSQMMQELLEHSQMLQELFEYR